MIRCAGWGAVWPRILGVDRPWTFDFSLLHGESRCAVSAYTPSDACGLGRSSSSAKGWVLAMLARKRELRVALVPRESAPFSRPPVPGQENHTRGGRRRHNAGGTSRAERRIEIMTRKSTQTTAKTTTPRAQPTRQSITFELVTRLAPHQGLADNLVRTFGLEPVDYDSIRDATGEHIARTAKAFGTALNEKALQIHLQRVTGAFVSSAFGAAQFYGTKVSAAKDLTSKLFNDDRDEDRDGPIGFESKAERARLFAAEMALQSYALMAAAEGAISAYADITGDDWKPYAAPTAPAASVSRKSAATEMAAFELA
jgi:hypothetical protein